MIFTLIRTYIKIMLAYFTRARNLHRRFHNFISVLWGVLCDRITKGKVISKNHYLSWVVWWFTMIRRFHSISPTHNIFQIHKILSISQLCDHLPSQFTSAVQISNISIPLSYTAYILFSQNLANVVSFCVFL